MRSADVDVQSAAGAFTQACDIGYSTAPVSETLVDVAAGKAWSSFFDRLAVQGTDLAANVRGVFSSSDITQVIRWAQEIDGVVSLASWYLVVSVMADGATGIEMAGMVTVLEGVSSEALANFL